MGFNMSRYSGKQLILMDFLLSMEHDEILEVIDDYCNLVLRMRGALLPGERAGDNHNIKSPKEPFLFSGVLDVEEGVRPEGPTEMGLYFLCNEQEDILYIGRATNIASRLYQHFGSKGALSDVIHNVKVIKWIAYDSTADLAAAEIEFITHFRPPFNSEYNGRYYEKNDPKYQKPEEVKTDLNQELTNEEKAELFFKAALHIVREAKEQGRKLIKADEWAGLLSRKVKELNGVRLTITDNQQVKDVLSRLVSEGVFVKDPDGGFATPEARERLLKEISETSTDRVEISEHPVEDEKEKFEVENEQNESEQESFELEELPKNDDELYDAAAQLVVDMQTASVSMLQRRFKVGYTRAALIMAMLEENGIVGSYGENGPRKVLITRLHEENIPVGDGQKEFKAEHVEIRESQS